MAGMYAIIFASIFFASLIATTLIIGVIGIAPGIVHLSESILHNTVKYLGIESEGAIFPVVLFWSMVVYVFVFFYAMNVVRIPAESGNIKNEKRYIIPAVLSVTAFVAAMLSLFLGHQNKISADNEKMQALDFVRHNDLVMQEAGGNGRVDLVSFSKNKNGSVNYYDIGVYGNKNIYAIVEPLNLGSSKFTLICTTTLYMGKREPFKHPCKQ